VLTCSYNRLERPSQVTSASAPYRSRQQGRQPRAQHLVRAHAGLLRDRKGCIRRRVLGRTCRDRGAAGEVAARGDRGGQGRKVCSTRCASGWPAREVWRRKECPCWMRLDCHSIKTLWTDPCTKSCCTRIDEESQAEAKGLNSVNMRCRREVANEVHAFLVRSISRLQSWRGSNCAGRYRAVSWVFKHYRLCTTTRCMYGSA